MSDVSVMTDADALLAAIIAAPADDAPRLVYADAIQESDPDRAEFVRVQVAIARTECGYCRPDFPCRAGGHCAKEPLRAREADLFARHWPAWGNEWFRVSSGPGAGWLGADNPVVITDDGTVGVTVRRGFVESLSLPLAAFLGARCPHCPDRPGYQHRSYPGGWDECGACLGGRTPGAAGVCRVMPVTKVVLVGCEPAPSMNDGIGYAWVRTDPPTMPHHLPTELFDRLPPGSRLLSWVKYYPTAAAATAALSLAALAFAAAPATGR